MRAYLPLLVLTSFCLNAVDAQAYLDPGTGSLILQGIIGTVAAVAAVGGLYWARVKAFFGRNNQPPPADIDDIDKTE